MVFKQVGCVVGLLIFLSGCATVDQRAGFSEVSAVAKERTGMRVVWNAGTKLDAQVAQEVQSLLKDQLTVEQAVQVALLSNRDLQAVYAALGVAQADLVQAGLLKNPVFDGAVLFPIDGSPVKLEMGIAFHFLDLFYMPLRKRVAAARFEDAKLRVSGAVIDFAASVRSAFYRHQTNEQTLELRQTIAQALAASLVAAQRLHEAGNITDLDLARERALKEESKLQLGFAEMAVLQSREQLNTSMGLWGNDTSWKIGRRLPDVPEPPLQLAGLEGRAIRRSIDLASARQKIVVAGEQLGVTRATALVPELPLGVLGEREDGEWKVGPVLEIPIPLFDQGQGRIGRAMAELRFAQQEYYALGVRIRSTVRAVRDRLRGARDMALYYRDIMLPLRERIMNETMLQYNAMQLGVIDLLLARERQIRAAVAYVEALRDYWLVRTQFDQILSGRLPSPVGLEMGQETRQMDSAETGGH